MPQDQKREQQVRLAHAQRVATGEAAEAERWNEVFLRGVTFNLKPNNLLAEAIKGRKPGAALDVGMGQGRNALYLAKQGWESPAWTFPRSASPRRRTRHAGKG